MKLYLGDSVYAESDSTGGIVLTTENGEGPSNCIYMEPQVFKNLLLFQAKAQVARLENNLPVKDSNLPAKDAT
jgi:hypothetical protein